MASSGVLVLAFGLLIYSTSVGAQDDLPLDLPGFSLNDLGSLTPGIINDDVDSLLETFGSILPEELDLGTFDRRFAYNCVLRGLDNGIYREGDAFLEIPDTAAIFTFGLSTGRLTLQCQWKKRVILFVFGGTVKAHTNKVSVRANMTLELAPGAAPKLEEFKLTHMDRVYTDITGAGLLDWVGETVLNTKIILARDLVFREIERELSKRLQNILGAFTLPDLA